jgi:hypothetical protein
MPHPFSIFRRQAIWAGTGAARKGHRSAAILFLIDLQGLRMDLSFTIFLYGLIGSVGTELVAVVAVYQNGRKLPVRYQRTGFWIARGLLMLVAGSLAVAYQAENRMLAVHIGASTQVILWNLMTRTPSDLASPRQDGQRVMGNRKMAGQQQAAR